MSGNEPMRLGPLAPGAYRVEAYAETGFLDAEDVVVVAGEERRIKIGEPPPVVLTSSDNPFRNYERTMLTRRREGDTPATLTPHRPNSGLSGVTLGYGYDVGSRAADRVRGHLGEIGLAPDDIEAMANATGLQGGKAQAYFDAHRTELSFQITPQQRDRLLLLIYPSYEARAQHVATVSGTPTVDVQAYEHFDFYVRELLCDLVYVGAHYSPEARHGNTAARVNKVLVTSATDIERMRGLRSFVESLGPSQKASGKRLRLQYIDAALEDLENTA